jgi:hypothetical protein
VHTRTDQRDLHVRPRRERFQQQVALEDEADDLAAWARRMGVVPDCPPIDQDLSLVGLLEPSDEAE